MELNIIQKENSFDKICTENSQLCELLTYLKTNKKYSFDRLNTIIAVDLGVEANKLELIYDLYSTGKDKSVQVSVFIDRNLPHTPSIVSIYQSAYFDECEIYDLFGVVFENNPNLKRLLMPNGWLGHPLLKDYKQCDERISWNE